MSANNKELATLCKKVKKERQAFLKKNKKKDFVVVKGEGQVILSAPHGVEQLRLGKKKYGEPGSLALALQVQKKTGVHLFAKTSNKGDDANFDVVSPYKEALKRYIKENGIKFLIDFHSLAAKRRVDVNFGVNWGRNIQNDEKLFDIMQDRFKESGFGVSVDNPFAGGSKTVAGNVAEDCNIWTIQLEINSKYINNKKFAEYLKKIIDILSGIVEFMKKS